jgi:hypothetical protein
MCPAFLKKICRIGVTITHDIEMISGSGQIKPHKKPNPPA